MLLSHEPYCRQTRTDVVLKFTDAHHGRECKGNTGLSKVSLGYSFPGIGIELQSYRAAALRVDSKAVLINPNPVL